MRKRLCSQNKLQTEINHQNIEIPTSKEMSFPEKKMMEACFYTYPDGSPIIGYSYGKEIEKMDKLVIQRVKEMYIKYTCFGCISTLCAYGFGFDPIDVALWLIILALWPFHPIFLLFPQPIEKYPIRYVHK